MTVSSSNVRYVPDLMDDDSQLAIVEAMERIYESEFLNIVWPAAYDAKRKNGNLIALEEVDLVVLPLDRIGAPAGASGASVYVIYFSHRESSSESRLLPSPPLVVKVGGPGKLEPEIEFLEHWPTLPTDVLSHFAMPIHIDKGNPNKMVLIAPFRSQAIPDEDGIKLGVTLTDLWTLLNKKEELLLGNEPKWEEICRHVGHALEMVAHVHRNNIAGYSRANSTYEDAYCWYLRGTTKLKKNTNNASRSHIPKLLFGNEQEVTAFGRNWPNPSHILRYLIDSEISFNGIFGPVHGDLHPKNIVIGHSDTVQIIDFGWAQKNAHVIIDYLLLDINLRGTTLPSQITQTDVIDMAQFLMPEQEFDKFHPLLKSRANVIKNQIWSRVQKENLVNDWHKEYLIPFFLVAYGLLVYLDAARNQPALIASVLAAADLIENKRKTI